MVPHYRKDALFIFIIFLSLVTIVTSLTYRIVSLTDSFRIDNLSPKVLELTDSIVEIDKSLQNLFLRSNEENIFSFGVIEISSREKRKSVIDNLVELESSVDTARLAVSKGLATVGYLKQKTSRQGFFESTKTRTKRNSVEQFVLEAEAMILEADRLFYITKQIINLERSVNTTLDEILNIYLGVDVGSIKITVRNEFRLALKTINDKLIVDELPFAYFPIVNSVASMANEVEKSIVRLVNNNNAINDHELIKKAIEELNKDLIARANIVKDERLNFWKSNLILQKTSNLIDSGNKLISVE